MYTFKTRVFELLSPKAHPSRRSRLLDLFFIVLVFLNAAIVVAYTFPLPPRVLPFLHSVERLSVIAFSLEYLLRLWTADLLYPRRSSLLARLRYVCSVMALVDLLSIVPYYLPLLFPVGLQSLRLLRLLRLFQVCKLHRYSKALSILLLVLRKKSQQLLSALLLLLLLLVIFSMLLYSVENPAQPAVFDNAFSGMWFAVSTLTSVGYGDIYPITAAGRLIASCMAFFGVALLAVPTAIISAGFIEQESKRREAVSPLPYCPHCGKKLH